MPHEKRVRLHHGGCTRSSRSQEHGPTQRRAAGQRVSPQGYSCPQGAGRLCWPLESSHLAIQLIDKADEKSFFSPLLFSSLLWSRPCGNLILGGTACPQPQETHQWNGRKQMFMISSCISTVGWVPHSKLSMICSNISKTTTAFLLSQWVSNTIHLLKNKVPVFI